MIWLSPLVILSRKILFSCSTSEWCVSTELSSPLSRTLHCGTGQHIGFAAGRVVCYLRIWYLIIIIIRSCWLLPSTQQAVIHGPLPESRLSLSLTSQSSFFLVKSAKQLSYLPDPGFFGDPAVFCQLIFEVTWVMIFKETKLPCSCFNL